MCAVMGARVTLSSILAVVLVQYSLKSHFCIAVDTIFGGQSLIGSQTIISQDGTFEFGFFTPGKSLKYYVGIWYKKVSVKNRTVVWVANRDQPLSDPSLSELKLLENGNLVLLNQLKTTIWTTNSTSKSLNSSQLVIQDDGNLVLRDGSNSSSNSSTVFWQSFDHFTDTWLPGANFGYDFRAREGQKLVSWKNSEDPSPGLFSVVVEEDSEQVVKWNGSYQYFTSGVWSGDSYTANPEMRVRQRFNYSFIRNVNESHFTYTAINKSLIGRLVIDVTGRIKTLIWNEGSQDWVLYWARPPMQCRVYNLCGAYGICSDSNINSCDCLPGFEKSSPKDWDLLDYSGGCVRKTSLQCGNQSMFSKIPNTRLPTNNVTLRVESADKCEEACSNNCSCNAYAYTSTGCLTWYDSLFNLQQLGSGGDDLYLKSAPSNDSSSGRKNSVVYVAVGVAVGVTALVVILVLILCRLRMKRKARALGSAHDFVFLTAFKYRHLKTATKNFSEELGEGSFGSVFKGVLPDSTPIAVKKLTGVRQGEKQFRSEVSTIGLIQHINLVRLRGFCSEGNNRMLVYDFMPNDSLKSHLFSQDDSKTLNWSTRYQIAIGIARGLAYLHEECRDCIIHCDIKPENILLDADLTPKVADFGLAKLLGREFSRVMTTVRGTIGYLAPEWTSGVDITAKADVYSYGKMLFEIISGRRNLKQCEDGKVWYFPTWAAREVISEGQPVLSILDDKLEGKADIVELERAFRVACWCIQEEETRRPSMGQVVQILEGLLDVNPPPIKSYLQDMVENEATSNFFSDGYLEGSNSTSFYV